MLKAGAYPNLTTPSGYKINFYTFESMDMDELTADTEIFYALLEFGADPNSKNISGMPLLAKMILLGNISPKEIWAGGLNRARFNKNVDILICHRRKTNSENKHPIQNNQGGMKT